jgi:anti-sigma factor RsiW
MNCRTYRHQMSVCLDGRLPAGKRAALMAHTDHCAPCSREWAELCAAQQLALELRKHTVSADFRDSLWERIRAGEAGPDVVTVEPVPLTMRIRWFVAGIAAAAAVIVAVQLFRANDAITTPPHDGAAPTDVARVDAPTDTRTPGRPDGERAEGQPTPRQPSVPIAPLDARFAAESGASRAAASIVQLRSVLEDLDRPVATDGASRFPELRSRVASEASQFLGAARQLRWMHERSLIVMQPDMLEAIGRAEGQIHGLDLVRTPGELRVALEPLRRVPTQQIRERFFVACCDVDRRFRDLILREPGSAMRIQDMFGGEFQIHIQQMTPDQVLRGQVTPQDREVQVFVLRSSGGGTFSTGFTTQPPTRVR